MNRSRSEKGVHYENGRTFPRQLLTDGSTTKFEEDATRRNPEEVGDHVRG